MNTELMRLLVQGVSALQLSLNESQLQTLLAFVQLLIKWNKAFNLTAIIDPYKIITRHILDSLSIVSAIKGPLILDVGSGAGLPGIPCAIALPDDHFTLLDSNGKKTRFITQAVGELKIRNVTVVQSRVEGYHRRACFNSVIVRAFASLEKTYVLTKHLCCLDGQLLIMKGVYPAAELQKIPHYATVCTLTVPGLQEERCLVHIQRFSNE